MIEDIRDEVNKQYEYYKNQLIDLYKKAYI